MQEEQYIFFRLILLHSNSIHILAKFLHLTNEVLYYIVDNSFFHLPIIKIASTLVKHIRLTESIHFDCCLTSQAKPLHSFTTSKVVCPSGSLRSHSQSPCLPERIRAIPPLTRVLQSKQNHVRPSEPRVGVTSSPFFILPPPRCLGKQGKRA